MPANPTPIPLRQLDFHFDLAAVPRDWSGSDPFLSTFCDSLSVLFPEGERFFIDSVKLLRHRVASPELEARVTGFIGQEAMHGREHRAFNEMLARQGFTAAPRVEARLRRLLDRGRRQLSPHSQLAITCALEHFTAMMAEALLGQPGMRDDMHAAVRPLWLWHALEESEHKAVAFDVYRASGGGELRRILIMVPTSLLFALVVGATHARFLAERGVLSRPWRWLRGIAHLWLWPGYLTRLFPAYASYYRPGFHPDQRDTRALLDEWRARLFGDGGELGEFVREAA
ncbi:MAG TPA: metal-dependent hydrolase [Kofleriaceae bacterium]|nr:metal-dependent hydrolase [Kofleriaceae bacterium]